MMRLFIVMTLLDHRIQYFRVWAKSSSDAAEKTPGAVIDVFVSVFD